MSNSTLEKLIWLLIYGGLLVFCLGLFVARQDVTFGGALLGTGAACVALGAFLIWLRSRRGP